MKNSATPEEIRTYLNAVDAREKRERQAKGLETVAAEVWNTRKAQTEAFANGARPATPSPKQTKPQLPDSAALYAKRNAKSNG